MKILFLGDVVGLSGRSMILRNLLTKIKEEKINIEDESLNNLLVKLSKNKIAVDNPKYSTFKKLVE